MQNVYPSTQGIETHDGLGPAANRDPPVIDPPVSLPVGGLNLHGAAISSSPHTRDRSSSGGTGTGGGGGPGVSGRSAAASTSPDKAADGDADYGFSREAPSISLPQQPAAPALLAVDIGGSLLKIVYFAPDSAAEGVPGGRLHFVKFETRHLDAAIDFIRSTGLLGTGQSAPAAADSSSPTPAPLSSVKATGGGAFKFASIFADRLGVALTKEDEMSCCVAGANFLLRAIRDEAFTFQDGVKRFVAMEDDGGGAAEGGAAVGGVTSSFSPGESAGGDAPTATAPPVVPPHVPQPQQPSVPGQQPGQPGSSTGGIPPPVTAEGPPDALFPYLLVNIGSGVSMLRVDKGSHERVSGTNLGGGTFWGLCRLLTGCTSFDEMLHLSARGDNRKVDMMVGDIYGGLDYAKVGLSADTIASSFGKIVMYGDRVGEPSDPPLFTPADLALSLLRMVSYNIAQIAVLNAMRLGLKRIFFGGFFIRGHAYTMETISFAIRFWSKGDLTALFLRHEGFLGALGAFLQHDPHHLARHFVVGRPHKAHCVERFPVGAPLAGATATWPPLQGLHEKLAWVEKFIALAADGPAAATPAGAAGPSPPTLVPTGAARAASPGAAGSVPGVPGVLALARSSPSATTGPGPGLLVGVLEFCAAHESFPLLAPGAVYHPDTVDIAGDATERDYWLGVLLDHLPSLVDKAVGSEGGTAEARRRGGAFARAFAAHVARLQAEPTAYGASGLAVLFERREETLREFGFPDAYRREKARENAAAVAVLSDLLAELDSMPPGPPRLLAVVAGVLAGNLFDWGAKACVDMYAAGTILDMYRTQRATCAGQRPWRVDDFGGLAAKWASQGRPYRRALLFLDNSGADAVLGMLPLARELLRSGADVVLAANTLPAINDVTADELVGLVAAAGTICPVLRAAAETGRAVGRGPRGPPGEDAPPALWVVATGHGGPCLDLRRVSSELAEAAVGADLVVLEGMGRAVHTNYRARFKCDVLKVALIKNARLAETLFGGQLYDCVCRFERAEDA